MPTRKQRRRQQKSRRHEYVWEDEFGNEVDPTELRAAKKERAPASERRVQQNGRSPSGRRPARTVEPPSWRRVGRRALMIGPLVIVAMMLLNRHLPLANRIAPAIVMLVVFLPFSYFTDSLAYRMLQKRLARQNNAKTR